MKKVQVGIPYEPRAAFVPFHNRDQRWTVIVAHRRAGKTVAVILDKIRRILLSKQQRPRAVYVSPLLKQSKMVAWDYVKHYSKFVPGTKINETELKATFPGGGQLRLYGADLPDSMRGGYIDECTIDEAADISPRLFTEIIRPQLSDRLGRCTWLGTPKGRNAFCELYEKAKDDPEYFTMMLKASETGIIPQAELDDARKHMNQETYDQEFECSFTAALVGSYYASLIDTAETEGRLVRGLYDPAVEVHTAWDLGASDSTVIWFAQKVSGQLRIIDCYAASGFGLDHYAHKLQSKGYKYGRHFFPHDVEAKVLTGGEIARTRRETLEGLGVPVISAPKWGIEDGINAVRRILPKCMFDKDKCELGISALRQYRREWDDVRKVFYERPYHDWTSDYADAFRYLAVCIDDTVTSGIKKKQDKRDMSWVV